MIADTQLLLSCISPTGRGGYTQASLSTRQTGRQLLLSCRYRTGRGGHTQASLSTGENPNNFEILNRADLSLIYSSGLIEMELSVAELVCRGPQLQFLFRGKQKYLSNIKTNNRQLAGLLRQNKVLFYTALNSGDS